MNAPTPAQAFQTADLTDVRPDPLALVRQDQAVTEAVRAFDAMHDDIALATIVHLLGRFSGYGQQFDRVMDRVGELADELGDDMGYEVGSDATRGERMLSAKGSFVKRVLR